MMSKISSIKKKVFVLHNINVVKLQGDSENKKFFFGPNKVIPTLEVLLYRVQIIFIDYC